MPHPIARNEVMARPMEPRPKTDDIYFAAMKAVFWVLCVGIVAFASVQSWPVVSKLVSLLTPFILGLILAYVFHPVVSFVQYKLKLGRLTGILVVAASIVAAIGIFFAILIPILYQQIRAVLEAIVHNVSVGTLDELLVRVIPDDEARARVQTFVQEWIDNLEANLESLMKPEILRPVASGSVGAVKGTFEAVGAIFGWVGGAAVTVSLALVATFYFLVEMHKVPSVIRRLLPEGRREKIWAVLLRADANVGGFLRGQLIACVGVGCLASAILFAIGLRQYAILIGFVAGAVNFVPYLGPAAGATPAILWAIFASVLPGWTEGFDLPTWGVRGILIGTILGGFAIVQMVDGFVFQPLIVGKSAALHPLIVMLALVVGAQFGVGGMIVAVPVACVVKVFIVEFFWRGRTDFAPVTAPTPAGGDGAEQPERDDRGATGASDEG